MDHAECQTFGSGEAEICQEMLANLKETFKYVKQVHVPESMNLPRRALEGNLGKWQPER